MLSEPRLVYDEDDAADLRPKTNGENSMAGDQQVMGA